MVEEGGVERFLCWAGDRVFEGCADERCEFYGMGGDEEILGCLRLGLVRYGVHYYQHADSMAS